MKTLIYNIYVGGNMPPVHVAWPLKDKKYLFLKVLSGKNSIAKYPTKTFEGYNCYSLWNSKRKEVSCLFRFFDWNFFEIPVVIPAWWFLLHMKCWEFFCIWCVRVFLIGMDSTAYMAKDSNANVVMELFRLFQQNYSALPLCPSFS